MSTGGQVTVRVSLYPLDAPQPLVDAVARVAAVPPEEVRLARHCVRCGGDGHGRPLVLRPRAAHGEWHVSLSRSATRVAVAVTDGAPVGIDVESPARLAVAPVERVLLHPLERREVAALPAAARLERIGQLWTAKEAVLKAVGLELSVEPSLLRLRLDAEVRITLTEWPPGVDGGMRILTLRLPDGEWLAVAAAVGEAEIRLLLEEHRIDQR